MKHLFLSIVCLSAVLVSCNQSDLSLPSELSINARINNSATRAEKLDWSENDQLGVFVCNGTLDKPYLDNADRYFNVLFRHNGKGFTTSDVYLDENQAEVFAYYPYNAPNTNGKAVPVESNSQTDYLYGHAETPASISQKNVDIEMKHALSQVVFKIRKAATYDEGAGLLTAVKIENNDANNVFKTAGNIDLSSGTIIGTSTDGILTLMPGSDLLLSETYQSISSICLPITSTAGKNVRAVFTIDGRQFRYEFPAGTTWQAGLRNIYTLTVDNSSIEIGGGGSGSGEGGNDEGITIEEWGASADNDISLVPIL